MLTSQVISLKLQEGNPINILGNHIHGFFFKEILRLSSPSLAADIHNQNTSKPFSLSFINKEKQIYWIRIASWLEDISKAVFIYFTIHHTFGLADCAFELIGTTTNKSEFDWADRIPLNEFIKKSKLFGKEDFWLEHFSPTSFKRGDSHLPLPLPELIINSIYKQLPPEILNEIHLSPQTLTNCLHLKEYHLQSIYNRKNHGSIASFIGKTRWQIDKKSTLIEKEAIWLLFNFAFFSGVGVKTTQGMGMCRIVPGMQS